MTYWLLNLFFAAAIAVLWIAVLLRHRGRRLPWLAVLVSVIAVSVLTVVFDNLMIAMDLFDYGDGTITGARIGLMPVEDFAYSVGAGLALPGFWLLFTPRAELKPARRVTR